MNAWCHVYQQLTINGVNVQAESYNEAHLRLTMTIGKRQIFFDDRKTLDDVITALVMIRDKVAETRERP